MNKDIMVEVNIFINYNYFWTCDNGVIPSWETLSLFFQTVHSERGSFNSVSTDKIYLTIK